jgi:hypothetical protein
MKEIFEGKIHGQFSPSYPASLLGVSAGYCQTALVGKSRIMRNLMVKHNSSVMVAVYATPCSILPRKQ